MAPQIEMLRDHAKAMLVQRVRCLFGGSRNLPR
jgi:hypothetical protein